MTTTRTAPNTRERPRLLSASSTKVAGRKIVVSMFMPGRPGRISSMAASTPLVTSSVLPQGSFSTIIIRPGPPSMTASPMRAWWSLTTFATSPTLMVWSPRVATTTSARSAGFRMGRMCRTVSRWLGVSMKPPLPTTEPLVNCSSPESSASEVAPITWFRVTSFWRSRSGTTCTTCMSMRSPQITALATPGTRSSRARSFQYAVID